MKIYQNWTAAAVIDGVESDFFPATVPGNVQKDYATAHNFDDLQFSDNYKQFLPLENWFFKYKTTLKSVHGCGKKVFFVSHGIDYQYDIFLGDEKLYSYEGMYKMSELDLTDKLKGDDVLSILIYPHPKREGAKPLTRDEADHSCKPPVCYGWDWNPRLLISGLYEDTYIELRDDDYFGYCEPFYELSESLDKATVRFETDCPTAIITLRDKEGREVYKGDGSSFTLSDINLWWCNGQGEPYLYTWTAENGSFSRSGTIGFCRVRLVKNRGAEANKSFPMSRYPVPITIELNGRRIFAKGSNFVNPEVFFGDINAEKYQPLVLLAKEANMNIFRMWGGSGFQKEAFYDLCDRHGIMVWQEFMLCCNKYPDDEKYLKTLESEASFGIKKLRKHPSVVMWCGGNELFNSWSGMDDQSLPLRLLSKLCYELDNKKRPFLMTSPLMGMGHGCYIFKDSVDMGGDVFYNFQHSSNTAYTEFGIPSTADAETLKKVIPADEILPITASKSWVAKHGMLAWKPFSHACPGILSEYFGVSESIEDTAWQSNLLASEGYKAAFEEMRKQWQHCSMAINWCYNEPWICAANCSVIAYPAKPKPAYYAIKEALRPTMFSARIPRFDFVSGSKFKAEIWLLNDSQNEVCENAKIYIIINGEKIFLAEWQNAKTTAKTNVEGISVCYTLPATSGTFKLIIENENGYGSEYTLLLKGKNPPKNLRQMNQ